MSITKKVSIKRKLKPSSENLNERAKSTHRNETFEACSHIHGSSENNKEPCVFGMIDTLVAKNKGKDLAPKILNAKNSLSSEISKLVLKSFSHDYYHSDKNILRSLSTYYSHNVMGKTKYISVRKANKDVKYKGVKMANYVPYKKLSEAIRDVNIGNVHDQGRI